MIKIETLTDIKLKAAEKDNIVKEHIETINNFLQNYQDYTPQQSMFKCEFTSKTLPSNNQLMLISEIFDIFGWRYVFSAYRYDAKEEIYFLYVNLYTK